MQTPFGTLKLVLLWLLHVGARQQSLVEHCILCIVILCACGNTTRTSSGILNSEFGAVFGHCSRKYYAGSFGILNLVRALATACGSEATIPCGTPSSVHCDPLHDAMPLCRIRIGFLLHDTWDEYGFSCMVTRGT